MSSTPGMSSLKNNAVDAEASHPQHCSYHHHGHTGNIGGYDYNESYGGSTHQMYPRDSEDVAGPSTAQMTGTPLRDNPIDLTNEAAAPRHGQKSASVKSARNKTRTKPAERTDKKRKREETEEDAAPRLRRPRGTPARTPSRPPTTANPPTASLRPDEPSNIHPEHAHMNSVPDPYILKAAFEAERRRITKNITNWMLEDPDFYRAMFRSAILYREGSLRYGLHWRNPMPPPSHNSVSMAPNAAAPGLNTHAHANQSVPAPMYVPSDAPPPWRVHRRFPPEEDPRLQPQVYPQPHLNYQSQPYHQPCSRTQPQMNMPAPPQMAQYPQMAPTFPVNPSTPAMLNSYTLGMPSTVIAPPAVAPHTSAELDTPFATGTPGPAQAAPMPMRATAPWSSPPTSSTRDQIALPKLIVSPSNSGTLSSGSTAPHTPPEQGNSGPVPTPTTQPDMQSTSSVFGGSDEAFDSSWASNDDAAEMLKAFLEFQPQSEAESSSTLDLSLF
ncbi:unnamed protein product [Somion occarium]|uniref:Uncharacterized protein n=1 Tax=Somion occarium TaxID=3059160 RepID=A0ABP1DVF3_9APHY